MYLDTLLEIVTPSLFAQTYASDIESISGEMYCSFDNLPGKYRIHAGGFIAENLSSSALKAGSIIDIKAMSRMSNPGWGIVYREAVGAITRKFKNILPVGMTDQLVIDRIADEALKRRKVFNACVCKSRPLADLPGGLMLRANNDLSGLLSVGGVSFLSPADLKGLEGKLRDIGINVKLPNKSVLLVPYFSSAYEVACIELIYGKQGSDNDIVWFNNKEIAISGLLGLSDTSKCFMEKNLYDAVKDTKTSTEDYSSFFSVNINPDGNGVGWLPVNFFYVLRSNDPIDLIPPSKLIAYGSSCVITRYPSVKDSATPGNSVTWVDAVTEAVSLLLDRQGDFSPQSRVLLHTVRSNKAVKERLKERLEALGKYWLADKLDVELRDGAVWEDAQGCLYSTAQGYLWEENNARRLGGSLVTNFTITPTHSVRYDTGELYRAMEIQVGGGTREILLSPTSFDTVKKFAERVEEAIALSGHPTLVSPTMFDQLHSRPLLIWMNKLYSDLPIRIGTSYLGWNPTRTKFIGTGFYVTEGETKHVECQYRPGIDYLRYFSDKASPVSTVEDIPYELKELAYQCAGIIMRSYSGHTLMPVEYTADKGTRETMQRVFSYAGQLRAVQLNKNMRAMGEMACLEGYPFAATGYNRNQAKACKTGMILLGETGKSLGAYTPEEEKAAGMYIRYIIEALPGYLIRNCGPSFVPTSGVITDKTLAEEGKKVIDEMEL